MSEIDFFYYAAMNTRFDKLALHKEKFWLTAQMGNSLSLQNILGHLKRMYETAIQPFRNAMQMSFTSQKCDSRSKN